MNDAYFETGNRVTKAQSIYVPENITLQTI